MKVRISPLISHQTDNQRAAEVRGSTVGQCLQHLGARFPKLKLFGEKDELCPYLIITVNKEFIHQKELDKPAKDSDGLSITLVDIGG